MNLKRASLLTHVAWFMLLMLKTAFGQGQASDSGAPTSFLLKARTVYTGVDIIHDGMILVEEGKIVAVGRDIQLPPGVVVVDFSTQTVIPGLVEVSAPLAEQTDFRGSIAPDLLAVDAFDLFADRSAIVAGGVTTLGVASGSRRLLSGRGCVVKSGGHNRDASRRILSRAVGYNVTLGEGSKRPQAPYEPPVLASPDKPFEVIELQSPVTRGGAIRALRRLFDKLRHVEVGANNREISDDLSFEQHLDLAALEDLFSGEDFLLAHANRANDLLAMIDLAREFGVRLAFDGAREAYRVADRLAALNIPVLVPGTFVPGRLSDEDLTRRAVQGEFREGLAALLSDAGVHISIKSPEIDAIPHLLLQAVEAVGFGLSPQEALRAVTLSPAEILGVDDRVGSIAPGKDADLVVLSADPFSDGGSPVAVFIDGEAVYPKAKAFPDDITIVRAGRVLTATEGEIAGGVIVIRDGKILAVGTAALLGTFLPKASNVIDASEETVVPGLLDAGSQLGVHSDTLFPVASDNPQVTQIVSGRQRIRVSRRDPRSKSAGGGKATYRIVDAVDPRDPQMAAVLGAGITTVILTPDPVGAFSGQLTAMKLSGGSREEVTIKDPVALLVGSINASQLKKAKTYHDQWLAYEKAQTEEARKREKLSPEEGEARFEDFEEDRSNEVSNEEAVGGAETAAGSSAVKGQSPEKKPQKPRTNEEYEVLRALFRGELPALVSVASDTVLPNVLANLTDKYKVETIVYGFDDLRREAIEELTKRNVGILVGPRPVWEKSLSETVHLPRMLAEAGISFGFRSGSGSGARQLPMQIAYAVRRGWSDYEALRAMTIDPARLFGIDDRVGSIEAKKDADLVFLNGRPFAMTTRVTRVMIDGKIVFEEAATEPASERESEL